MTNIIFYFFFLKIQQCYTPEEQNSLKEIISSPKENNKHFKDQKIQTDISETIKEEKNRCSSNIYGLNTLEYIKYEKTKTNPNLNSQSNNIMVSNFKLNNNNNDRGDIIPKIEEENEKVKRRERKKSTIAEFHQIKIPSINKDINIIDSKNNINLISYSNTNNTKNTKILGILQLIQILLIVNLKKKYFVQIKIKFIKKRKY